jgi:hypothetical protein
LHKVSKVSREREKGRITREPGWQADLSSRPATSTATSRSQPVINYRYDLVSSTRIAVTKATMKTIKAVARSDDVEN